MNQRSIIRGVLAVGLVIAAASCGADLPDGPGSQGLQREASVAAVNAAGALEPGSVVEFFATDFAFAPNDLVAQAGSYSGLLVNQGDVDHDIQFANGERFDVKAGGEVEIDFEVPPEGVEFLCTIPGHADAGMTGVVQTPESAASAEAAPAQAGPSDGLVLEANPDTPAYALRDPNAPARGEGEGVVLIEGGAPDGGDLIEVEMVVEEKLMTVADGFEQLVWTFNGEVPGPTLRTEVGDTVRVHLVNPIEAAVPHSLDFHASQVAWNGPMRSINPGEDLIYEFTTEYAGVWMYHCGTDPVLHHIANGMFGMVIVEPEGGLEPVEHEFFFVQNEWYLGPQGEVSSFAKANQAAPAPDFVMFNGIAAQYLDNPIEVPTGEDVRLFVLDVGPSIDSSFHIVGTIFHDVIKEGIHLVEGNDGNWGSQAVDLAPAQGAVIEFRTAEDGLYPLVTHAFNFPGRGAIGLFQSGDGEP